MNNSRSCFVHGREYNNARNKAVFDIEKMVVKRDPEILKVDFINLCVTDLIYNCSNKQ